MKHAATILFRMLLVLYLAALAFLCFGKFESLPDVSESYFGLPTDKIVHFLMFLPFPLLTVFSFSSTGRKWWQRAMSTLGIFLCGCMLAGATEMAQGLTTYRTSDIGDFYADVLALAVCTLTILIIDTIKTCSRKQHSARSH